MVRLFPFFSFVLQQLGIEKCFCPYHVTYQPINKIEATVPSETQRGVIKAIEQRIWIKTAEMVVELRI